jgi:riboflavin kinase/FMN adenylyltransferase
VIRHLIADGAVADAAELLGRSYRLAGEVVHGDERGGKLGFPTANLGPDPRACLPGFGIYAGWWIWRDKRLPGVINVGVRPTFKESDPPLCEIHVFDFDEDLYGERGEVEFTQFLRPEERFDGVDALVKQISADAARARELLTP